MSELEQLRRNYVEQAIHSGRMEGQEPSLEFEADAELWVVGEITLDEEKLVTKEVNGWRSTNDK